MMLQTAAEIHFEDRSNGECGWRGGNDDVKTDYRFVWLGPTVT